MTLYATKGVELFKGGLFLERGVIQNIYIHGDLCLTFRKVYTVSVVPRYVLKFIGRACK